jgi:hypothetical protein
MISTKSFDKIELLIALPSDACLDGKVVSGIIAREDLNYL